MEAQVGANGLRAFLQGAVVGGELTNALLEGGVLRGDPLDREHVAEGAVARAVDDLMDSSAGSRLAGRAAPSGEPVCDFVDLQEQRWSTGSGGSW
ncbi:hypothetical protein [Kitasatospora sp. NPDC085879]|uniref:hypothetical protein n=1 Tax=Kitasatospora sp. NPDC085879 TaxID=3154769 RepID=UPI00342A5774